MKSVAQAQRKLVEKAVHTVARIEQATDDADRGRARAKLRTLAEVAVEVIGMSASASDFERLVLGAAKEIGPVPRFGGVQLWAEDVIDFVFEVM